MKATLVVQVTDFRGQPLNNADVAVSGLGTLTTAEDGLANFDQVEPGSYDVSATKKGYRPAPKQGVGPAKTTRIVPAGASIVVPLRLDVFRENLIFIGSEMDYKIFWTKMMFIAAAWFESSNYAELRPADRTTVAYVDNDYTKLEKQAIDNLRKAFGFEITTVASNGDIVALMNNRFPTGDGKFLLQDVVFFSHGGPSEIWLNYDGGSDVDYTHTELYSTDAEAFVPDGLVVSYACRTGNSSHSEHFASDAEARPHDSLAQMMADHFEVKTKAFLTRTDYGRVLREKDHPPLKDDSARIAGALKVARSSPYAPDTVAGTLQRRRTQNGGPVIDIPPDHEALPHPGLGIRMFSSGAEKEGTDSYALWRKAGGIRLPESATTPTGLSRGLQTFTPKKQ